MSPSAIHVTDDGGLIRGGVFPTSLGPGKIDYYKKINPIESDPYGISTKDPGAKLDAGKPRMDLLKGFDLALIEVAKVLTIGAQKYSEHGWKDVPDGYKRYSAAMLRHYFASGDIDDGPGGTGMLHDAQTAWNALARLQYRLEGKL